MNTHSLLIEKARQIVYFEEGRFRTISDGYIVIRGETIEWVGNEEGFRRRYAQTNFDEILNARAYVVLPGLIDSHTHTIFAGSREEEFELKIQGVSYQEIAARGGGIKNTMRATRAASHEELYTLGRARLRKALEFGITTLEIKSGYGLSLEDEIKILEVIARLKQEGPQDLFTTFLGAHTIPPEFADNRSGYVHLIIDQMIPAVAERKLADFCDVFCETHVFTPEETRTIFSAAREAGLALRLHADQLTNTGGAELAAEMQALSADHLENISDRGIQALRESGVVAGLLPGCSFFLNMRYPPARQLIEAGIPVALATDFNPGSCMTQNLPLIMSIACTQMRLTPAETIAAVTWNAARSLNCPHIGNIQPGMQADLALFDVPDYRYIPYHFGQNHIGHVIKKGKRIIEKTILWQ